MDLTDELKVFLNETACTLKGSARRVFMARAVRDLGEDGQRLAERELGWSRVLVRKGRRELAVCRRERILPTDSALGGCFEVKTRASGVLLPSYP